MNFLLACAMSVFLFSGPETELIAEINKEREAHGVTALSVNWEVARLARYRTEEMIELNFFGHNSRIYGEPDEMLIWFGVPFVSAGMNIAKGQDTAKEVIGAWLSSPSHRENLLNADFTSVGVGLSVDEDILYWTLILIGE